MQSLWHNDAVSRQFQLQGNCRLILLVKLTLGSLVTFGILYEAKLMFLFAGRAPRQLRAGILRMLLVAIVNLFLNRDIGE